MSGIVPKKNPNTLHHLLQGNGAKTLKHTHSDTHTTVYYTDFATQKPRAQSREAACASAPTIWAQSDSQPSLGNGTIANSEAADSQVRERNERPLRGEGERNRQRKKIRGNPTERNPGAQRKDRFGSGKARTLRCFTTTTTTDDKCGAFQNRNGRVWEWMRMKFLSSV